MQKDLAVMQRGSYYLRIHREDLVQQQPTVLLHDSVLLSLIDQRRLRSVTMMARAQVKLILAYLQMLCKEIVRNCRELDELIVDHMQSLADRGTVASVQQKLQETHQYVRDFRRRRTHTLGPLSHPSLIPNVAPMPRLSITVVMKMPVMFDRFKLSVTSSSVSLRWYVTGEEPKEANEQFEIHARILHPTIGNHGQSLKRTSKSHIELSKLISDRHYEFSVKRVDTISLVYRQFIDTVVLRTLGVSECTPHKRSSRAEQCAGQKNTCKMYM